MNVTRQSLQGMAPIPVALCGKNPNMAASFASHEAMGPEYYGLQYCSYSSHNLSS